MNKTHFFQNPKNIAITMAMFFVADRIIKFFAINNLLPKIDIGGFLKLSFTPNSFIAFSLPLSGTPLMFIVGAVTIALISFIIYLIINKKTKTLETILLTTILFGAISNYTDRINYGFVIDYIDLKNFTVFNLADVMIVFGAGAIILKNFKKRREVGRSN